MSSRRGGLRQEHVRVLRAQAHGASFAFNCGVRITEINFSPAAEGPRPCQIRIEHKSSIDKRGALLNVAYSIGKADSRRTECERVIPAQLGRAVGQPCSFRDILFAIGKPAVYLAMGITP